MPVYELSEELAFPSPLLAEEDGLLAYGGDLRPERLLLAYANGIFPWPHEGHPLLWFSPDPRMVLPPAELHVSRRLARTIRQGKFRVTLDTAFEQVIAGCATADRGGDVGTWIIPEMVAAYTALHEQGVAHSAEAWLGEELAGGLYGVSLGGFFTGESMFSRVPDASKAAFVALVRQLERWGFLLVDVQLYTPHLARFGAREWPRARFEQTLHDALRLPTRPGPWRLEPPLAEPGPGGATAAARASRL
jgi:leucyl/phenylalanyl-tRNA--protein transferase